MLSDRLRVVKGHIDRWLDVTALSSVTVVSACTGDGRDLLDVLHCRTDADQVRATLVESDPGDAARASWRIGGLDVLARETDTGTTDAYAGTVPSRSTACGGRRPPVHGSAVATGSWAAAVHVREVTFRTQLLNSARSLMKMISSASPGHEE